MESFYVFLGIAVPIALLVLFISLLCAFRKKRAVVCALGTLLFAIGFAILILTSGGAAAMLGDMPSALWLGALGVSMLFISGHAGDFVRAFKIAFGNALATRSELKKASASLLFLNKVMFVGAVLFSLIGAISMLNYLEDTSTIRPNIVICILPFCYAFVLSFFLMATKGAVDRKIADESEKD